MNEPAITDLTSRIGLQGSPAFRRRSFMLDISRDRVPTMSTLRWLIDVLAALRYNEMQLYIEHTYEYSGHEAVWGQASALSAKELVALVDYGSDRGLEIVANLNTFGHMERWLQHDPYRARAECPDGLPDWLADFLPGPTCLAPTQENADFALALARELTSVTGSPRLMIGGDEPIELGFGKSTELAAEVGQDVIYRTHLGRIIGPLTEEGFDVMFWGDKFRTDPDAVDWIPQEATCVVWNYEAPRPEPYGEEEYPALLAEFLGVPADGHLGFSAHARLAIERNKKVRLACGTSSWNSFLGRTKNAAFNIGDAAEVGVAAGIEGFMITDWGDNGHWQPLVVSLPSIVRGAVAAWTGAPASADIDIGGIVDDLLGAPAGSGALVDELGEVGERLGVRVFNASPAFDALIDTLMPVSGNLDVFAARDSLKLLADARRQFGRDSVDDSRWGIAAEELAAACQLTELGVRVLLGEELTHSSVEAARSAHRKAWLRSSRRGGLDDSLARLPPR